MLANIAACVPSRKRRNVMSRAINMTAVMRCMKSIWLVGVFFAEGKTSIIVGMARRTKTTVIREERTVVRVRSKRRRFLS